MAELNPRLVYGLITDMARRARTRTARPTIIAGVLGPLRVADLLTRLGDTSPFQRGGMGTT